MTPQQQQRFQQLLGEYYSQKLANSKYANKPRAQQLAYILGLANELLEHNCRQDSENLERILAKMRNAKANK